MARNNQNDSFFAANVRKLKFLIMNEDVNPVVPFDLTGLLVRWSMCAFLPDGTPDSDNPILLKDNAGQGGVVAPASVINLAEVTILKTDIVGIDGRFYHELEVVDEDNNPVVLATGTLCVHKNVVNTVS